MNILLSILSTFLCFTTVTLIYKFFKKDGLYVWLSIASIIANILVCKNINMLGMCFTLGNILFASNFFVTDIISEKYSLKDSIKGVSLSLISVVVFIISTQIGILFIPDITDVSQNSMSQLFSINLRTSIASVTMFFLSNLADVYLFEKIKAIVPNKLWLRSNISSIICNCLENFLFCFLAFIGIYDIEIILSIAITTSLAEILLSLLYTPFLYICKKIK